MHEQDALQRTESIRRNEQTHHIRLLLSFCYHHLYIIITTVIII